MMSGVLLLFFITFPFFNPKLLLLLLLVLLDSKLGLDFIWLQKRESTQFFVNHISVLRKCNLADFSGV
jgi:hypothetical protein